MKLLWENIYKEKPESKPVKLTKTKKMKRNKISRNWVKEEKSEK